MSLDSLKGDAGTFLSSAKELMGDVQQLPSEVIGSLKELGNIANHTEALRHSTGDVLTSLSKTLSSILDKTELDETLLQQARTLLAKGQSVLSSREAQAALSTAQSLAGQVKESVTDATRTASAVGGAVVNSMSQQPSRGA